MVSSVDTHLLNVVAEADSFAWEFDLKDAWLTKARFNTLIRQYIDPVAAENWLDTVQAKLGKRKRGTAVMRTNLVQKRGNTNRPSRQWGSCMLAISFRRIPVPQITLYRSEEHTSELQSLMRNSYAVFCLKKNKKHH